MRRILAMALLMVAGACDFDGTAGQKLEGNLAGECFVHDNVTMRFFEETVLIKDGENTIETQYFKVKDNVGYAIEVAVRLYWSVEGERVKINLRDGTGTRIYSADKNYEYFKEVLMNGGQFEIHSVTC